MKTYIAGNLNRNYIGISFLNDWGIWLRIKIWFIDFGGWIIK